ncbi:MAG: hypothetical protein IKH77_06425 [Clostridia bacterium]|nr:hypothetical protein [Clostridia bacterium]
MLALLYCAGFLFCGGVIVRRLLPRLRLLVSLWMGGALGLLLMMWLPALLAFGFRFSLTAHWLALIPLALLTGLSLLVKNGDGSPRNHEKERRELGQALLLALPLTLLFLWLQHTHVYRVDGAGNWNVGQSTYGDLAMHSAFAAGLRNAPFPPEYPMFPGHRLTYPFLTDSLSTSFLLLGCSLQAALILPAVLMFLLTCLGVYALCGKLSAGKKAAVLAFLFFFLNGGLGFLYDFDQAAGFTRDGVPRLWERVQAILQGYYKTPTNQPEPNNLRWSNVIADLFVPQRTFLGGVCMVLPCLWLLFDADFRDGAAERKRGERLLALWAGALPLVHTHSFLALGLCSAGVMLHDLIRGPERGTLLRRYLGYAGITLVLAAPQLVSFTFYQALGLQPDTRSGGFVAFQFNWVNNPGGQGMRDFWLWFYVKNIGLPFLLVLGAVIQQRESHRRLLAGAGMIWLAAELFRFQPNEYDNNKLFYVAWLLLCPAAADTAGTLWRRMKGLRFRQAAAGAAAVVCFLSAGLTLWREAVSDYQAFDARQVAAAAWVEANTPEDSVFIASAENHLNPVDSIAGRRVVCGPDLWLYYHGFDTSAARADVARWYAAPAAGVDVVAQYGVDYVYVSDWERSTYDVDEEALDSLLERVYDENGIRIWRVPEG